MTLDDLPEFPTLDWLETRGFNYADVRRRCPSAVEYGPANAIYFHRDDLAGLFEPEEGDDA